MKAACTNMHIFTAVSVQAPLGSDEALTECHVRYHIALWDNGSIGQL